MLFRVTTATKWRFAVSHQPAMTLVEMLVAMTATLIMMGLVAQLFGMLGKGVNGSRNRVELYNRLRSTAQRLKQDLGGATAPMAPPLSPENCDGYFEYVEGIETDIRGYGSTKIGKYQYPSGFSKHVSSEANAYEDAMGTDDRVVGDVDDILLFTTRSSGDWFSGRLDAGLIQSPVAEVAWFCRVVPNTFNPRYYNLYRRQLLVMAHPAGALSGQIFSGATPNTEPFTTWRELFERCDVSCRVQAGYAIPNTLGDLTKREYRFSRNRAWPYEFRPGAYNRNFDPDYDPNDDGDGPHFTEVSTRFGEDLILTNCIGFDVRVLDVDAPVSIVGDVMVWPGEPGYGASGLIAGPTPTYVDLGWSRSGPPIVPTSFSPSKEVGDGFTTYDTWSTHYGENNLDDDDDNHIDELDERAPPYPSALRGIEVRIRCIEPTTREILQLTVREDF